MQTERVSQLPNEEGKKIYNRPNEEGKKICSSRLMKFTQMKCVN